MSVDVSYDSFKTRDENGGNTVLEHFVQPCYKVGTNKSVKIGPAVDTGNLTQDSLDSSIDSTDPQHMTSAIRAAPDPDLVLVDLRSGLSVRDGVRIVAGLLCRNDFLARLAFLVVAVTESTIVVY